MSEEQKKPLESQLLNIATSESTPFLLYATESGQVKISVVLKDETIWLTQKAITELFGVSKSTISEHLANIYETGELAKDATVHNIPFYQKIFSRFNIKYHVICGTNASLPKGNDEYGYTIFDSGIQKSICK